MHATDDATYVPASVSTSVVQHLRGPASPPAHCDGLSHGMSVPTHLTPASKHVNVAAPVRQHVSPSAKLQTLFRPHPSGLNAPSGGTSAVLPSCASIVMSAPTSSDASTDESGMPSSMPRMLAHAAAPTH